MVICAVKLTAVKFASFSLLFTAVTLHFQRHFMQTIYKVKLKNLSLCKREKVHGFSVKTHQKLFVARAPAEPSVELMTALPHISWLDLDQGKRRT